MIWSGGCVGYPGGVLKAGFVCVDGFEISTSCVCVCIFQETDLFGGFCRNSLYIVMIGWSNMNG